MPGTPVEPDAQLRSPADPFIRQLIAAGSELGRQLDRWRSHSLRQYLRSLIPDRVEPPNPHLLRLADALERYLTRHGDGRAELACEGLLAAPVIQQADHSNLLLDAETFLNNYLFHLACREAGSPVALVSQCSRVSCIWKRGPFAGPVFLQTRGALLRVFPLSNRQFKRVAFCCLPPLPMTFDQMAGEPLTVAADPLLGPLAGTLATEAPAAYRAANDQVWNRLDLDHGIPRVACDDSLASECLALHLEDPASPVHRLLFDPPVRDRFLATKRELVAAPDNLTVSHASPDFLWLRDGSRLRKVTIEGRGAGALAVTEPDRKPLPLPLTPEATVAGLRHGRLFGDLVLEFAVRCLLPGAVAIGGTSQQDYVELFRRALLETHRQVPFLDPEDAERIASPGLSRLGGRPLLELDEQAAELIADLRPDTRLAQLEEAFLDLPLETTIGSLECASYFEPKLRRAGVVG